MTSVDTKREPDAAASPALELDDIQSGVLRPRPSPYAATYIVLRIDDQRAGRELMRRLSRWSRRRRIRRVRRETLG